MQLAYFMYIDFMYVLFSLKCMCSEYEMLARAHALDHLITISELCATCMRVVVLTDTCDGYPVQPSKQHVSRRDHSFIGRSLKHSHKPCTFISLQLSSVVIRQWCVIQIDKSSGDCCSAMYYLDSIHTHSYTLKQTSVDCAFL